MVQMVQKAKQLQVKLDAVAAEAAAAPHLRQQLKDAELQQDEAQAREKKGCCAEDRQPGGDRVGSFMQPVGPSDTESAWLPISVVHCWLSWQPRTCSAAD